MKKFDEMTPVINDLQEEFEENDSELETAARESNGETVEYTHRAHRNACCFAAV